MIQSQSIMLDSVPALLSFVHSLNHKWFELPTTIAHGFVHV